MPQKTVSIIFTDCCVRNFFFTGEWFNKYFLFNQYFYSMKFFTSNHNLHFLNLAVNQETGASGRRYQGITLTGWIRCNFGTRKKQVDVKHLYNSVPQTAWVSWSQLQVKFELQVEAVRTSSLQNAWALRTLGWATQQNEKLGVNML